ncbi:hypothetical protein BGZ94_004333 [Podila epigama]|nr:hypothetical protein BGZ94_004333 [Podila epigama]
MANYSDHFSPLPQSDIPQSPKRRMEDNFSLKEGEPFIHHHPWAFHRFAAPRQRQESGSSVSSTSSWGSATSNSSTYSTSSTSECPPLVAYRSSSQAASRSASPQPIKRTRPEPQSSQLHRFDPYARRGDRELSSSCSSSSSSSSSPSPSVSAPSSVRSSPKLSSAKAHTSSLSDLVFAIALDASLTCAIQETKKTALTPMQPKKQLQSRGTTKADRLSRSDSGLSVVFNAPNWLDQHMQRAKRIAVQRSCSRTPLAY